MAISNRIHFPCEGVYISEVKSGLVDHFLNGLQSVGLNHSFNTTTIPDTGKSQRLIQSLFPENQITIERVASSINDLVFDPTSTPTDYASGHILNNTNMGCIVTGSPSTDLKQYDIKIVYGDPNASSLSGTARDIITCQKCLLTNLNYSFSVNGAFKERYTFSNKIATIQNNVPVPANNTPITLNASQIFSRRHFDKVNTVLPIEVYNVSNDVYNNGGNTYMNSSGYTYISNPDYLDSDIVLRLSNIEIDVNINHVKNADNGRRRGADVQSQVNYWTSVSLPLDITSSFEITTTKAYGESILNSDKNFDHQRIVIILKLDNGYYIYDLGVKNKLTNIEYTGGSTNGELVKCRLSYKNTNNDFSYYMRSDLNIDEIKQTTESY